MFEALFKTLAARGHEVDIVSHFPSKTPTPRYHDFSIRGSMLNYDNNLSFAYIENHSRSRLTFANLVVDHIGVAGCKKAFNTPALQKLKQSKKVYDLVVTELFGCDCMLGFGHIFKAPVVSITTSVNLPWSHDRFGNPDNPSYIPDYFVPFVGRMNLLQRLENSILLLMMKFRYFLSADAANSVSREFFGDDLPDLRELAYNTSLMLVNNHFSINYAAPNVPNVISVAGLHIPPLKPLPKHLEDVMNVTSEYKGVIYLSMGSMVLTETLPIDKLSAFFEAFRGLPYKILWKASREKMPKGVDIPPNIHFEPWMPQVDILCHPNTKLFVSHGGLMGTQEALMCGVPRIGIPLFADQDLNLKTSEAMGLAVLINYNDLTKDNILNAAKKVLENESYRENAKIISERFQDRPLSPLDTAIYWVEYVIRHKGAPHLRSVGADLPWYQYYLLDVGAIIFGTIIAFLILVCYMILILFRMLRFLFIVKIMAKMKAKSD